MKLPARQGFSGKLVVIVPCGVTGLVSAVRIGEDEVVSGMKRMKELHPVSAEKCPSIQKSRQQN